MTQQIQVQRKKIKRGKKYIKALSLIPSQKELYSPEEAINLIKKMDYARFDSTIEIAVNLKINPQKAEQNIRGTVVLPHGIGKTKRVVVVCPPSMEDEARKAGADMVGLESILEKIKGGWFDFDVLIATPDVMPKLAPLGRILGPRGLMPSPKNETVTKDIATAVKEFKKGKIQIRNDKYGIVHMPIGKKSMDTHMLLENLKEAIQTLLRMKPPSVKGEFIKSVYISSTMSPSLQLNVKELLKLT